MRTAFTRPDRALAALALGVAFLLAGCGGGGGGGSTLSTAPPAGLGFAGAAAAPAGGSPATAEVRYTLGPVATANTTTAGFQTLEGMAATPDGGWRIVWSTGTLDANNQLQLAYFEQRYDAAGQRVGGETSLAGPGADLSGSRSAQVAALGGGTLQFTSTDAMRPGLFIQQVAADGTAVDAPITLGTANASWSFARVALADGTVAIGWQPVSSVGPGELQAAVLRPGPR